MPDSRVDYVHRIYEAWNTGGLEALGPSLADAVELHDAPEMPDAGTVRGRDAVLARLREVSETMGGGSVDVGELEGFGDRVLVPMIWKAGAEAGSTEFGEVFHVVRMAGDMIVSMHVFVDERAAREAARGH